MQSTHSLTVISLGGGVQSSVMALMASGGAFGQLPDCAIFADTHWEPPTIYTHLHWLSRNLSFPLYVVDNGRSLREDAKALTNHFGNRSFLDLPVYLKGRDGESDGMGRRQCTEHYKIAPVRWKMRELLGLSKGTARPHRHRCRAVARYLHRRGYSHEAVPRRVNTQPLPPIEAGMSRRDCMELWKARYDRSLERWACIGCPYQSRQRCAETKRRWPKLFAEVVEIDSNLRGRLAFTKEPYLHPLRHRLCSVIA